MSFGLHFDDSEVAAVRAEGGRLRLRFSAASVEDMRDGSAGFLPGLELVFDQAAWEGEPAACFGRLVAGRLGEGGVARRVLPLPYRSLQPVTAEFEFRHGERLVVRAASAHAEPGDEAQVRTSYAC